MEKVKIYSNEQRIMGEFLRRYVCFHEGEDMYKIRLWGLFSWGTVSKMIKECKVKTDMKKENKTIWCQPHKVLIDEILKPAYQKYLNDTGRHKEIKFDFDSYDRYIWDLVNENGKLKEFVL